MFFCVRHNITLLRYLMNHILLLLVILMINRVEHAKNLPTVQWFISDE